MINENYTKVPNEILETIVKAQLNATHFKIVLTVIRYTLGFQRKEHQLSVSFIAKSTNSSVQSIKRGLKELIEMRILTVKKEATFSSPRVLKVNENTSSWILKEYQDNNIIPGIKNDTTPGIGNDTPPGIKNDTQEIKERNIKETAGGYSEEFKLFWDIYPRKDSKAASYKRFKKALKHHTAEELIEAASNYAETVSGTDLKFIKVANNFFGDEVYLDYINMEPSYVEVENWRGSDKRL